MFLCERIDSRKDIFVTVHFSCCDQDLIAIGVLKSFFQSWGQAGIFIQQALYASPFALRSVICCISNRNAGRVRTRIPNLPIVESFSSGWLRCANMSYVLWDTDTVDVEFSIRSVETRNEIAISGYTTTELTSLLAIASNTVINHVGIRSCKYPYPQIRACLY